MRRVFEFFLVSSGFHFDFFPIDVIFAQSLSYCCIMNSDLKWDRQGLQLFRCCSGFFFTSSMLFWSKFGWPATSRKVHHCSKLSPFVHRGSLQSQSLSNGFVAHFRLKGVEYLVSQLFLVVAWCLAFWDFLAFFTLSDRFYRVISWLNTSGSNQAWVWLVKLNSKKCCYSRSIHHLHGAEGGWDYYIELSRFE